MTTILEPISVGRMSALLSELRSTLTPVLGYLELIADDDPETLSEEQLRWVAAVEQRLEGLEDTSRQLISACAELRGANAAEGVLILGAAAPGD